MKQNTQEVFTKENTFIQCDEFVEELRIALKDVFIAQVERGGNTLDVSFPGGQKFILTVWNKY